MTSVNSDVTYIVNDPNCTIMIVESILSSNRGQISFVNANRDLDCAPIRVILQNVAISNSGLDRPVVFSKWAVVRFVNCNNTLSALQVSGTNLIFGGHNLFRNNSGLVGGAIQLTYTCNQILPSSSRATMLTMWVEPLLFVMENISVLLSWILQLSIAASVFNFTGTLQMFLVLHFMEEFMVMIHAHLLSKIRTFQH